MTYTIGHVLGLELNLVEIWLKCQYVFRRVQIFCDFLVAIPLTVGDEKHSVI